MRKRLANYHSHIYLCKHATGTSEDYIKKAITLNYDEIGISDHGPLSRIQISRRMSKDEYQQIYLPELIDLKQKYQDKIKVLRAVEVEFFPECLNEYYQYLTELDYLILGQHDIIIDNQLKSVYSRSFTEDDLIIYGDMVTQALKTGLFKILAHPEIFMFALKDYTTTCEKVSAKIINAAYENKVYLEFNANGLRKYIRNINGEPRYTYPHPSFWKQVAEFQKDHPDLLVIIGDDSHSLDDFNDNQTKLSYELLDQLDIIYQDKIDLNNLD